MRRRRPGPPAGKLETVVTYLEMRAPPVRKPSPHGADKLALMHAEKPTVSFYRYLYNGVGEAWLWYQRRRLDDAALGAIIHDREVEVHVLYAAGVPAGYFELDGRQPGQIELAYLGLLPEFIGRGLGGYLLDRALDRAWSKHPARVWVHTCDLDHPRAILVYRRAGFVPYDQKTQVIDDPRRSGIITGSASPT